MTKDNLLFGIVGLLLGLILGFMITNSLNSGSGTVAPTAGQIDPNAPLPEGHPNVPGQNAASMPEVQAAVEKANQAPEDFDAQVKAAGMYYQIQRYDDAAALFERANKLKPDEYEVVVKLGNVYFDGGKFSEAEKWYEKALAKKADDINVRTDLGLTFIFRDPPDYDRAIKEFLGSLEVDPNHPQTLQNLVVAYTKKGEVEKANDTLAKFEKLNPGNAVIPRLREEIQKIKN